MGDRSPRNASRNDNSTRGFALLTVLLGMAVLAALVAAIGAVAAQQGRHARNLAEAAKAEALADGGVRHAMVRLRRMVQDPTNTETGQELEVRIEDGSVEVRVADLAGRVDLNAADDDLLAALLLGLGLDQSRAERLRDSIRDWTDSDDLRRLHGAEAAEYRAAGLAPPANRPFALVEEVRLVLGMTPELFRRLDPMVTVHARQRAIDPGVAPPELTALLRGEAARLPPAFVMGSPRQVFAIRAIGRTAAGATFVREAVVRVTRDRTKPPIVLAWRRGRL